MSSRAYVQALGVHTHDNIKSQIYWMNVIYYLGYIIAVFWTRMFLLQKPKSRNGSSFDFVLFKSGSILR